MNVEARIETALRETLGEINLRTPSPPDVVRRVRRRRTVRLISAAVALSVVTSGGFLAVRDLWRVRPVEPATPGVVPFKVLPVKVGWRPLELVGSPLAPRGFPDCTRDLVSFFPELTDRSAAITLRPRKGVQCGLAWWSDGFWTGADGQRYQPPPASPEQYSPNGKPPKGRLLLMGTGSARMGAPFSGKACELQAPVTYSVQLADETIEVGSIDAPVCEVGAYPEDAKASPYQYQFGGLETPAGSLTPRLEIEERRGGRFLDFVLQLTNKTEDSIVIGRCPFYDATFVSGGQKAALRSYLNCPEAPDSIPPEEGARFQIRLPLNGIKGPGKLHLLLRDENRVMHRVASAVIEGG